MANIGNNNNSTVNALTTVQSPWFNFWNKFWNKARGFKENATPVVKQAFASTKVFAGKILRFNYLSLIAALLLVMASEAGLLESFPALQWLAGAELRLWNWFSGLIMGLANWIFTFIPEIHIPILSDFFEWARYILLGS